jgi:hypothetical protein
MPDICELRHDPYVPVPHAPAPDLPGGPPDLRRRDARSHAEQIAGRARFLPREERALISAVYEQGRSIAELAALCGKEPRALRRDVRRIVQRLAAPEFAFVVLHADSWSGSMGRVARCCIVEGYPVRRAAQALRLSLHTVRKHRDMVRAMAVAARGAAKSGGAR